MRTLKIVLPITVLVAGVITALLLDWFHPEVEMKPPEALIPLVRVLEVQKEDLQLTVHTQGTVQPRTEMSLVPEVSGRVIQISPDLVPGGFYDEGEILLSLDPLDYELARVRARGELAQAKLRLAEEEAEAAVARKEWDDLGQGEASPLTLREPQLAEARARLESARAALRQAERDLERTKIRAPFTGRVRDEQVDVGQFLNRGSTVATLYAIDYAEIRLPLPDEELAFLELPLGYEARRNGKAGPPVILKARFAGQEHFWRGTVVRTEGEIDPRSRMVHAVARVEDPYGRDGDTGNTPLAAGMFVEAEILGRSVNGVVVLPRAALRGRDRVLVVRDGDRLHFHTVDVMRAERERVIVRGGLEDGDLVCLSQLDAVVDGMKVRTVEKGVSDTLPSLSE